jgi:hypothetical protein
MAEVGGFPPGMFVQCQALLRLCPELEAPLMAGKMELGDTRAEVWSAYWRLLKSAIKLTL